MLDTKAEAAPGSLECGRVEDSPLAHTLTSVPGNPIPTRVLVLGLGNDILTDDAAGLLVARAVGKRFEDTPDIAAHETTEMGLTLLDEIVDCRSLILVDSVQTGEAPVGHVHELHPDDLPQVSATSPHFVGVGETLSLGTTLGLTMPQRVRIFAIEVEDPFTLGLEPTPAVARAIPVAVERIVQLAREWNR